MIEFLSGSFNHRRSAAILNAALQDNSVESAQYVVSENQEKTTRSLFDRFQELSVPVVSASETARKFQGKVTDYQGLPVANAVIAFWSVLERKEGVSDRHFELVGNATTDASGLYSVQLNESSTGDRMKSGGGELQVVVVDSQDRIGYRGRSQSAKSSSPNSVRVLDELLDDNSGRIEGTLLAPGGRPLGGLEIRVVVLFGGNGNMMFCDYAPFQFLAVTDEEGHFEIDKLPTGQLAMLQCKSDVWECAVCMATDSSVDTSTRNPGISVTPQLDFVASRAVVRAYQRIKLSGTVVDSSGIAVVGVKFGRESTSDDQGKFTISLLDFNKWDNGTERLQTFEIVPPPGTRFPRTYLNVKKEDLLTGELPPFVLEGEWLRGRVLSSITKMPLAGVEVKTKYSQESVETDVAGQFQLPVKPGQLEVRFVPAWINAAEQEHFLTESSSRRAIRQVDVISGSTVELGNVLINVDRAEPKLASIKVVSDDGKQVVNCRIELFKLRDKSTMRNSPPAFIQASLNDGNHISQQTKTDPSGIAILRPTLGWDEKYTMFATYPSDAPQYFGVAELAGSSDEVVELRLTKAARIVGRVTLNGAPMEGAVVMAKSMFHPLDPVTLPVSSWESNRTDINGNYVIRAFPLSLYNLSVVTLAGEWSGITALETRPLKGVVDENLEIIAREIALISGKEEISGIVVDDNGKPVDGAIVQLDRRTANNELCISPPGSFNDNTTANGRFRLKNVPSGNHRISVRLMGGPRVLGNPINRQRQSSVVAASGETDLEIVLP